MSQKSVDEMTEAEVRAYAKKLEKQLAALEKPDYVYFLLDAEQNRIKIGHSQQVEKRREILSKEVGRELSLLGAVRGGRQLKRQLKTRFQALLTNEDEWFRAEGELMQYIKAEGNYATD